MHGVKLCNALAVYGIWQMNFGFVLKPAHIINTCPIWDPMNFSYAYTGQKPWIVDSQALALQRLQKYLLIFQLIVQHFMC